VWFALLGPVASLPMVKQVVSYGRPREGIAIPGAGQRRGEFRGRSACVYLGTAANVDGQLTRPAITSTRC